MITPNFLKGLGRILLNFCPKGVLTTRRAGLAKYRKLCTSWSQNQVEAVALGIKAILDKFATPCITWGIDWICPPQLLPQLDKFATPCITWGIDWICPPQLLATAFGHLEPEIKFRLWHSFAQMANQVQGLRISNKAPKPALFLTSI